MRKVAVIFLLAVIIPSGALAWLALRSLRDEQLVQRARQQQLYQTVADSVAKDCANALWDKQAEFAAAVEALLAETPAHEVANTFDERLRKNFPFAEVAFAVTADGNVTSPNLLGRAEGRRFRIDNDQWLANKQSTEVYVTTVKGSIPLRKLDEPAPEKKEKIEPSSSGFRQVVGDRKDGFVARFLQNNLHLLAWHRPSRGDDILFGAELSQSGVRSLLEVLVEAIHNEGMPEAFVAIIDDKGAAVSKHVPSKPLASSEIGEILPHWKVVVYPSGPQNQPDTTASLRYTLGALVLGLLGAIAIGSLLLLVDLRRQFELARQKTDFVSNVSHELKTPLTSIRMFSEMLAEGRIAEPEKQRSYLKIINSETARLTRLINNILDFARMEKGEKKYRFEECDLVAITRNAIENYRPQLEAHGFRIETHLPGEPVLIKADCDAIAQVILNLLSNAEKYSGEQKEIRVEVNGGTVAVFDRGLGVPKGAEEKIFGQFYRAHDSLSSGIQGSGLGLTLARQIARAHGGDVTYEPREGGGSIFTLRLPA